MPARFLLLCLISLQAVVSAAQFPITVFVVRHAEKAATPPENPPLNDAGERRAALLSQMLADSGVDAIYTSNFARTRNTAKPLADRLRLDINDRIPPGKPEQLAAAIVNASNRMVLVVGHSNTVPSIVRALGGHAVPAIDDSEYDNLYIVTVTAPGQASVARIHFGEPTRPKIVAGATSRETASRVR